MEYTDSLPRDFQDTDPEIIAAERLEIPPRRDRAVSANDQCVRERRYDQGEACPAKVS